MQPRGDLIVAPCLTGLRGVGLQQDAYSQQLARRVLAGSDQRSSRSRSSGLSMTAYFLTALCLAETESTLNQPTGVDSKNRSFSTTKGTRCLVRYHCRAAAAGADGLMWRRSAYASIASAAARAKQAACAFQSGTEGW